MRIDAKKLTYAERERLHSIIGEGSARMLVAISLLFTGEEREDMLRRQMAVTKILFSTVGADSFRTLDDDIEAFKNYALELIIWSGKETNE